MTKTDILNILNAWFESEIYNAEEFADQYIAPRPSEVKETERSCLTCIDKREHGITENCKTCDQFTYSNWKPITTP